MELGHVYRYFHPNAPEIYNTIDQALRTIFGLRAMRRRSGIDSSENHAAAGRSLSVWIGLSLGADATGRRGIAARQGAQRKKKTYGVSGMVAYTQATERSSQRRRALCHSVRVLSQLRPLLRGLLYGCGMHP